MSDLTALLEQHRASISEEDEDRIDQIRFGVGALGDMADNADLAVRTCACGMPIDGFDEYLDHLISVVEG